MATALEEDELVVAAELPMLPKARLPDLLSLAGARAISPSPWRW